LSLARLADSPQHVRQQCYLVWPVQPSYLHDHRWFLLCGFCLDLNVAAMPHW